MHRNLLALGLAAASITAFAASCCPGGIRRVSRDDLSQDRLSDQSIHPDLAGC